MSRLGFLKKYLRAAPYVRRLKMLPHLTKAYGESLLRGRYSQSWKPFVYPKYEGRFADVLAKRSRHIGLSLTRDEVYTLYTSVLATKDLPGVMAEVGVHRQDRLASGHVEPRRQCRLVAEVS